MSEDTDSDTQSDDQWVREFARSRDLAVTLQKFKAAYRAVVTKELMQQMPSVQPLSYLGGDAREGRFDKGDPARHLADLIHTLQDIPRDDNAWKLLADVANDLMMFAMKKAKDQT